MALVELPTFLQITASLIRAGEFVSRSRARTLCCRATADIAWDIATDSTRLAEHHISADDWSVAEHALAWARSSAVRDEERVSEFIFSMRLVASQDRIGERSAGTAAAIINTYRTPGEHIGVVGQKMTLALTVSSIRDCPGFRRGSSNYLYKATDEDGNDVIFYSTKNGPEIGVAEGETANLYCTVAKHSSYLGRRSTRVKNVTVARIPFYTVSHAVHVAGLFEKPVPVECAIDTDHDLIANGWLWVQDGYICHRGDVFSLVLTPRRGTTGGRKLRKGVVGDHLNAAERTEIRKAYLGALAD